MSSKYDVWRDFSKYISVYTKKNFDEVPHKPGVYAWFYPILLPDESRESVTKDVTTAFNYDSKVKDIPQVEKDFDFAWEKTKVRISNYPNYEHSGGSLKSKWNNVIGNDESALHLEKILLVSSILMPPLYIGKSDNLNARCSQHINTKSRFRDRFESHTCKNELNTKKVNDLIFVCIKTNEFGKEDDDDEQLQRSIEEILNIIGRPPYGRL
jgi:hypothetical protein